MQCWVFEFTAGAGPDVVGINSSNKVSSFDLCIERIIDFCDYQVGSDDLAFFLGVHFWIVNRLEVMYSVEGLVFSLIKSCIV